MPDPTATVGVIANPAAATDIRRVIANATSMPVADRANTVLRVMAALGALVGRDLEALDLPARMAALSQ